MRILADENMPFVQEAFSTVGSVRLIPGRAFREENIRETDILLVRSVTRVDRNLIGNNALRFVGSATIGTDHVDEAYLKEREIPFAHAPGCNADSVVEYILASLFQLATQRDENLRGKTVGIVGCGNIGSRLADRLPALGFRILKNDPPLAQDAEIEGRPHDFVPLETLLSEADIITLHVPLTRTGPFATHHLFNEPVLRSMRAGAWLLNSCRGAVVSNSDLRKVISDDHLGPVVLDVWENEPTPDPHLIRRVDLATPHIAGYSFDGKIWGTIMLYLAVTDLFDLPRKWDYEQVLQATEEDRALLSGPVQSDLNETEWIHQLLRQMYDISTDDADFRAILEQPEDRRGQFFSDLRKNYPRRRSFSRHKIYRDVVPDEWITTIEEGLRVQIL